MGLMDLKWHCFVARIASEKSCLSQLCPLLPKLTCKTPFFLCCLSFHHKSLTRSQPTDSTCRLLLPGLLPTAPVPGKFSVSPSLELPPRCCSPVPSLSTWSFFNTPVGLGRVKLVHPWCKTTPRWTEQWALQKSMKVKLLPFTVSELGS